MSKTPKNTNKTKPEKNTAKKPPEPISRKECEKEYVDRITKKCTCEPWYQTPQDGTKFWRPKVRGDKIVGYIGKPITNMRLTASYPIRKLAGELVELPGNKQLHKLIAKADVFCQLVEIEYVGMEYIVNGHYRKIYRLYKMKFNGIPNIIERVY